VILLKISDIKSPQYTLLTHLSTLENDYEGCYATDLLSAAIQSALSNNVLLTLISNQNTIGLAMMIDLPAVIITEGKKVSEIMIKKANEEEIAILSTTLKTHEVIIDLLKRGLI
jgi:serine kinase of HPr protein (carbohydrate metabolism regulator)